MKKILFSMLVLVGIATTAQVKVGDNPTNVHTSAMLQVDSTTKGFLPPRMTQVQMNAIVTPASGLITYCLDCSPAGLRVYDGSAWASVGGTASPTVVADCNTNGFVGSYVSGVAVSGASFSVTITNISFSSVGPITFSAGDLVLSGITGLTVGTPTPTSATINSGASQVISYPITGTPASTGTLTGTWTKLALNCVGTRTIGLSDVNFTLPQSKYVVSTLDGTPLVNIQGFITNTAPNQLVINVPYTGGTGSYSAYTSSVVTGTAGEGGDVNGFSISYPAGTFSASGNIAVTVTVHGDGTYSAKKKLFGASEIIATIPFKINGNTRGNILLGVMGGIPDRMFGLADNNGNTNTHKFIYASVTGADGKTWLNNNLGAHYANINHASFNPAQQATSATDHLAYGSLFQWGRKGDGHELITWTNSTTGTPVNGTTGTLNNTPTHALFITNSSNPFDWRSSQNDTLWATEASANNPCPVGYRMPTEPELNTLVTAASITNSATAANSTLKFTVPGFRSDSNGTLNFVGSDGYYWSSSVGGIGGFNRGFNSGGTNTNNYVRAPGLTVRCLKD